MHASAEGHEYFLRHYLGTYGNAIAPEVAGETVQDVVLRQPAPRGKMDLVVDVNFRMDTTAMFSDIVLPAASWYEKHDLNTTGLHSYIHPLGQAVPPCWESRADWDIFRALAEKISEFAGGDPPFRDVVATPLLHDTVDEIAQPEVRNWYRDECDPIPGKTMPHFAVVERDYGHEASPIARQRFNDRERRGTGFRLREHEFPELFARECPSLVKDREVEIVFQREAPGFEVGHHQLVPLFKCIPIEAETLPRLAAGRAGPNRS